MRISDKVNEIKKKKNKKARKQLLYKNLLYLEMYYSITKLSCMKHTTENEAAKCICTEIILVEKGI